MKSGVHFFISAVSREFGSYRDALAEELDFPDVRVETQEKFISRGRETLLKLDDYILMCDAVVHIVGDQIGYLAAESGSNKTAIIEKHPIYKIKELLEKLKWCYAIKDMRVKGVLE